MTTGNLSRIPGNSLEPVGCERRSLDLPGFLRWKDVAGAFHLVPVRTTSVSELDVLVECESPATIPLYRLVYFQVDRASRDRTGVPEALRRGHVLSVVYGRGLCSRATGTPTSYAIRLLIDRRPLVSRVDREAA